MEKGYLIVDCDNEVVCAGADREAVLDYAFEKLIQDCDQIEIVQMLEALDYQNLDDLRMDMVYRGFTDFWEYMDTQILEVPIIGADQSAPRKSS